MDAKSRAMVFNGSGKPFELCEFNLPTLGEGEVLVQITCSTICRKNANLFSSMAMRKSWIAIP